MYNIILRAVLKAHFNLTNFLCVCASIVCADCCHVRFTCTCRSVAWSGKAIPLCHDDGGDAQNTHHREVYEAWLWRAVKRVVEPRHERAHYQQSYTRVIQPKHTQKLQLLKNSVQYLQCSVHSLKSVIWRHT